MEDRMDECILCLERINPSERCILECGHGNFHNKCIRKHFKQECPLCRTPHSLSVEGTPPPEPIQGPFVDDGFGDIPPSMMLTALQMAIRETGRVPTEFWVRRVTTPLGTSGITLVYNSVGTEPADLQHDMFNVVASPPPVPAVENIQEPQASNEEHPSHETRLFSPGSEPIYPHRESSEEPRAQ